RADQPESGGEQLGEQGGVVLPLPERNVQQEERRSAGGQHDLGDDQRHRRDDQQDAAQAEQRRGEEPDRAGVGGGALEADQCADETERQQYPVHLGQALGGDRGRQ